MRQFPRWPLFIDFFTRFLTEADESHFTITARGTGTADVQDADGGGLLVTSQATTENTGAAVQCNGAHVVLDDGKPIRFMTKVKISEATQSDLFAGFYETDTDPAGGIANGIYFRKADGETRLYLVHEKATVETVLDTGIDVVADTEYELAFQVATDGSNGTTNEAVMSAWVNGKAVGGEKRVTDRLANSVVMRGSLHFESGSAVGTMTAVFRGVGWRNGSFS